MFPQLLEKLEQNLIPASLARMSNWPPEYRHAVQDRLGRDALWRIYDFGRRSGRELVFLGTPYDPTPDRKPAVIRPRQSRSTDKDGYYFYDGSWQIFFVDVPDPAILRAFVNRHMECHSIPGAWARNWSGWFTAYGRLWLMTHEDMITLAKQNRQPQFVVVCDLSDVPRANIWRKRGGCEVFVLQEVPVVAIVPVVAREDLPPSTIVIPNPDGGKVSRAYASSVYAAAKHNLRAARQAYGLYLENDDRTWPIRLDTQPSAR